MSGRSGLLLLAGLLSAAVAAAQAVSPAGTPQGFHEFDPRRDTAATLRTQVTLESRQVARRTVIGEIARQSGISFALDPDLPGLDERITLVLTRERAGVALLRALQGSRLRLLVSDQGHIVIRPSPPPAPAPERPVWRVSGRVRHAGTLEPIAFARLVVSGGQTYTSTADGLFLLHVPDGHASLRVAALGFSPMDTALTVSSHATVEIRLNARAATLASVLVEGRAEGTGEYDPRSTSIGVVSLRPRERREAPPLLGEPDPVRDLTTLPGIASATDASVALTVRGGRTDGNLFLLDGAPVYNPSHVYGVLSSLQAEAIDAVTVHKGTAPARLGGRLSSVIEVRQREGNAREVEGSAAIGLLSSRAQVEGPLGDRMTFMVAARRSYADALFRTVGDDEDDDAVAYFYDLNGKLTWRPSATAILTASGFVGRDRFGFDQREDAGWGNSVGALRWSQVVGQRLLSSVTLARGSYHFEWNSSSGLGGIYRWRAGIASTDLRVEERLPLGSRGSIEFGGEVSMLSVRPGTDLRPALAGGEQREVRRARSAALFLGHEVEVGNRLALQYGVRWSGFERRGAATVYRYADDAPLLLDRRFGRYVHGQVVDSTRYAPGQGFAGTGGLEPRLSLRFSINASSSLRASVTRQRQYLHQVSGASIPLPTDIIEPAGPWIRPMHADLWSLGWVRQGAGLEWSVEVWHRRSSHLVGYIDGVDVAQVPQLETITEQGEGRASGLEAYLRRESARSQWSLSYTFSKAEERYPASRVTGDTGDLSGAINDGQWFPSDLDRRHLLTAAAIWRRGERWSFGSTFSAASGLPFTPLQSTYWFGLRRFAEFGPRNSARLPAYHRLDVNANRRLGERGSLQLGVLNVYNRFNPQFFAVRPAAGTNGAELVQLSVYRALPTISYTWRF